MNINAKTNRKIHEPAPVEAVFADIIESIPAMIERWADSNGMAKALPYHYDVLYIQAKLAEGYSLTVELKRTVTGGRASYDDATAIMQAFKRAHAIIAVDGTMKAYDLHLRYDKDTKAYQPLKMDIARLRQLDAKYGAMGGLMEHDVKAAGKRMAPEACSTAYPHVMKFRIG